LYCCKDSLSHPWVMYCWRPQQRNSAETMKKCQASLNISTLV
jgi:hypothetical protein